MQETIYVGIDVSSEKLDVCLLDEEEKSIRPAMVVENGHEGWEELKEEVVAVAEQRGDGTRVVCGMESTGNFHKRVEYELRCEARVELEVHVINPMAVKHFGKALLKDAKTDRVDSELVAKYLRRMQPKLEYQVPEGFEALKEATRTRREFIEERTLHKNRLHKLLRVHFPGYRKYLGAQVSNQLLVTIKEMPSPDKILSHSVEEITSLKVGPRHRVRLGFAESLRELAEVAPQRCLPPVISIALRATASRILELQAIIDELDAAIEDMLCELCPDQHLRSIPGIGAVSTAAILAEVGDIKRFPTVTDFIGYCGLYPVVWESGKVKRRYRMTRKGNRMLKMTFLVASTPASMHNPVIAAFYDRQLRRGKSKRAAGGASARKLAELVYAILSKNEPWSDETARRGLAKAEEMTNQAA